MSDQFDFERNGRQFRCIAEQDCGHGYPWTENEGHGSIHHVRSWGHPDKKPGDVVIWSEGGTSWIYDFQGAVAKARAEGWGSANCTPEMTPGQKAAQAARDDMNYCRQWLAGDRWHSVLEVFEIDADGEKLGESEYLGGVESGWDKQSKEYAEEEAAQMADEICARIATRTYAGSTVGCT